MEAPRSDLIRLEARPEQLIASRSRTVMICGRDGMITDVREHGVYVHETRVLSHLNWRLQGGAPYTVEASNVRQHSLQVYAIARPGKRMPAYSGRKRRGESARSATEETIELRLGTRLSDGFHQDADITNFTIQAQKVTVELELDADFSDLDEVINQRRQQRGKLQLEVHHDAEQWRIVWEYRARHRGCRLARAAMLTLRGVPTGARWRRGRLRWELELDAGASAHICLELGARIEEHELQPGPGCHQLAEVPADTQRYLDSNTRVALPPAPQTTVERALERARHDLAALRMQDLDRGRPEPGQESWVPAAGSPNYVATFGRDILTAAWQSAILGPEILRGSLQLLREVQGTRDDPWRDEEPGKMLHEAHTGPTSVLDYRPQGRYYGSFNTSPFYIIVLSEFWHWTGDRTGTLSHLEAARAALAWMDRYGHPGPKHFYSFRTRSSQGVKNQGWKDSGDALIYPDGKIVADPIATCEIQGYAYEAKLRMSELYWLAGEHSAAARVLWQAHELKKRFNHAYWMPEENYFAMALDRHGRQVRSVGSDPGDAMATGIIAADQVGATVERLFAPDMFSGWGIRTLSERHVAYNPYSYHRGSVWPAENAAIAVGLRRYGFTDRLAELMHAQLRIAERFQFARLPEVMCGHGESAAQPFPPVYPKSCSPQAWSAGAPLILLQMLLGIYPYAPEGILFLDPALPPWLTNLRLERLQVGAANLDVEFYRTAEGRSEYRVTRLEGELRILRQPSPWSVFARPAERVADFVASLRAA
ncbi:MAG TPA: glycogen debranching N-terminal domain-containing protein [Terriglobales bacterium]|nr:glycogen debranching N-terminal domain-containing protein [Terriglobales bacterium]